MKMAKNGSSDVGVRLIIVVVVLFRCLLFFVDFVTRVADTYICKCGTNESVFATVSYKRLRICSFVYMYVCETHFCSRVYGCAIHCGWHTSFTHICLLLLTALAQLIEVVR